MSVGRMAKDAHRVFRAHPEWRYEPGRFHPKKRHLRETIRHCLDRLNEPGVVASATGRFMAEQDGDGCTIVYLELGSYPDGV